MSERPPKKLGWFRRSLGVFRATPRAVALVWSTSRSLTLALFALTLVAGLLPGGIAWVGKLIVDAVVAAMDAPDHDPSIALKWVAVEAGLIVFMAAIQRGLDVVNSLLRAQLGHNVNVLILNKALDLSLSHFEDPTFYDRMTQARREASSRPLSLVQRSFGLVQNVIALSTYAVLLIRLSPWAVGLLALAAIPAFIAEAQFAGQAFRLFRWRTPEKRKQAYLEVVVAREDYAKEVKLLRIGPLLVQRYQDIYESLYAEDRNLTLRRGLWGFLLGLLSTAALYGAYVWIALRAMGRLISLGDMTMYLMLFKQGQSAFAAILRAVGGMYEDNLYLANLNAFLDEPVTRKDGTHSKGPTPGDGIRFEDVWFAYPDSEEPTIRGVDLHIAPGTKLALVGHNGSGKTTLIKLLTRLYRPTKGRILLDGLDLNDWQEEALRQRVGVIFQDFVKYQLTVGENIGVGDVEHIEDREAQAKAAELGMAAPFVKDLPAGLDTQLGRWFKDGRELSIGQWQKVALSRAFMADDADILVLDEPTSAMDAEAEAEIFERVRAMTDQQLAILISHRFSTARMADDIVVLEDGQVLEHGNHDTLMAAKGRYERLFTLQAAGYR
ncbi:MAG: ATP-binding cassette subfamily B protein [Myxococcota bacterium]|jgi:ATP-binding cassette subfamily B protein